jgi:hypothetical protein
MALGSSRLHLWRWGRSNFVWDPNWITSLSLRLYKTTCRLNLILFELTPVVLLQHVLLRRNVQLERQKFHSNKSHVKHTFGKIVLNFHRISYLQQSLHKRYHRSLSLFLLGRAVADIVSNPISSLYLRWCPVRAIIGVPKKPASRWRSSHWRCNLTYCFALELFRVYAM